jgi:hypothetical protein
VGGRERAAAAEEGVRIQILDEAEDDLQDGREFYDRQEPGLGDYFAAALASDIDSLILFAGIHPMEFGFHRSLSKRFPFRKYTIAWRTPSSASKPCSICRVIPPGFAEG